MVELTRSSVRGYTGLGKYHINPSVYYEGEWKDGLYDGMGVFVDGMGRRYEGEWVKGKQEGFGTVVSDDFVYVGYFKQNRYDGLGTYYQSYFVKNTRMIYDVCHGNWKQGKKHGEFIHIMPKVTRWELWEGKEMTSLYLDEESEPDDLIKAFEYLYAGMWVQLPEGTFLFDVENGPIPAMHRDRPVYVMVSGTDDRLFNDAIFSLAESYPDIYFLLPASLREKDYRAEEIEKAYGLKDRVFLMRGGEDLELGGVRIQALGDKMGLAYLVEAGGRRLLHGGTLVMEDESREAAQKLSRTLAPYFGTPIDLGMLPMDMSKGKRILGTLQTFRTFFSIKNTVLIKNNWKEELMVYARNYAPGVLNGEKQRKEQFAEVLIELLESGHPSELQYAFSIQQWVPEPEFFLLED